MNKQFLKLPKKKMITSAVEDKYTTIRVVQDKVRSRDSIEKLASMSPQFVAKNIKLNKRLAKLKKYFYTASICTRTLFTMENQSYESNKNFKKHELMKFLEGKEN